jgi:hypothetical protein
MVSMISMVSGMGRRWWLAWRCWPAAGHAYRKLISHGMIGHDRSMSGRSAAFGCFRSASQTPEPRPRLSQLSHTRPTRVFGLRLVSRVRRCPPAFNPPLFCGSAPLHVMGSVYVFSCSRVVSPVMWRTTVRAGSGRRAGTGRSAGARGLIDRTRAGRYPGF